MPKLGEYKNAFAGNILKKLRQHGINRLTQCFHAH